MLRNKTRSAASRDNYRDIVAAAVGAPAKPPSLPWPSFIENSSSTRLFTSNVRRSSLVVRRSRLRLRAYVYTVCTYARIVGV